MEDSNTNKVVELLKEMSNQNDEEAKKTAEEANRLHWMYKGPLDLINREDYLLGKSIDKTFEALNNGGNTDNCIGRIGEQCNVPKRVLEKTDNTDQVDIAKKILEDPLYAIKQKELEARKKLLNNPVKLKQIKQMLLERSKKQSSAKIKKKAKKKKLTVEELDKKIIRLLKKFSDKDKRKALEKVRKPDSDTSSDGSVVKEKKNKHSKKTRKRSPSSSLSTSSSSSSSSSSSEDSDSESDSSAKTSEVKRKRKLKSKSTREERKKVKTGHSSKFSSKTSDGERKKLSKKRNELNSKHKKSSKKVSDSSSSSSSTSSSTSESSTSSTDSSSDSSDESDRNETKKQKHRTHEKIKNGKRSRDDKIKNKDKDKKRHSKEKVTKRREENKRSDLSDNEKPKKHYGLMMPDGSKPVTEKRGPVKKYEKPVEKSTKYVEPQRCKPLSKRDQEKKLKEMMRDAKERKKEREKNIANHRKIQAEEEHKSYDEDFMRRQMSHLTSQGTMADRIKSNINNIQRSKSSMDSSFVRK